MSGARYAWDFSFLWSYRGLILTGLGVTIAYTIETILLGLVVGLAAGLLRLSKNVLITAPLVAYIEVFPLHPAPGADRLVLLSAAGHPRHRHPG